MTLRKALSIAGFDGSGGAGLQADLKTFSALGCYGMTVMTALAIQNTTGVKRSVALPLDVLSDQLVMLFDDIPPDAIKIGMLFDAGIVDRVASFLSERAGSIPIVLDPVMVAKSGHALLLPEAVESLKNKLFPLCTLLTPNLSEAEALVGFPICNPEAMQRAAERLLELGPKAVLVKGGHLPGPIARDCFLLADGTGEWLEAPKIETRNTHGTGCTLSAAIAACLALGFDLPKSVRIAKKYLHSAIDHGASTSIGKGNGPVHFFYYLWPHLESFFAELNA